MPDSAQARVVPLGTVFAHDVPVRGAPWRIVACVEVAATRGADGPWRVVFRGRTTYRWASPSGGPLSPGTVRGIGEARAWLDSSPQGTACRRRLAAALRSAAEARLDEDLGDLRGI